MWTNRMCFVTGVFGCLYRWSWLQYAQKSCVLFTDFGYQDAVAIAFLGPKVVAMLDLVQDRYHFTLGIVPSVDMKCRWRSKEADQYFSNYKKTKSTGWNSLDIYWLIRCGKKTNFDELCLEKKNGYAVRDYKRDILCTPTKNHKVFVCWGKRTQPSMYKNSTS